MYQKSFRRCLVFFYFAESAVVIIGIADWWQLISSLVHVHANMYNVDEGSNRGPNMNPITKGGSLVPRLSAISPWHFLFFPRMSCSIVTPWKCDLKVLYMYPNILKFELVLLLIHSVLENLQNAIQHKIHDSFETYCVEIQSIWMHNVLSARQAPDKRCKIFYKPARKTVTFG